jgi:DNA (cytosine-5)-methyltransferase 1
VKETIKLLDLFSGIGGFSLSAKWVWGNKLDIKGFCDIDEYCISLLEKRFPDAPIFRDIKTLTKEQSCDVDIITGGFPCQDISLAGKGAGINEGTRSGLWFEYYRLIRELRPRFAIIENVAALTSRGLNIVLRDLAEAGYDAEWQCISAKQVGAWHKRERIWVVAYPSSIRLQCKKENSELERERFSESSSRDGIPEQTNSVFTSRMDRVDDGLSNWLHEPRGISRVGKEVINRKERIHALGNSIVPQIPYLIFKRLKEVLDAERC